MEINGFLKNLSPEREIPDQWKKDWVLHKNKLLHVKARFYFLIFISVLLVHYYAIDVPVKGPDLSFWSEYRFGVSSLFFILLSLTFPFKERPKVLNLLVLVGASVLVFYQAQATIIREQIPYFYMSILPAIALLATSLSALPSIGFLSFAFLLCLPAVNSRPEEAYKVLSLNTVIFTLITIYKMKISDQVLAFLNYKEKIHLTKQVYHDLQSPIAALEASVDQHCADAQKVLHLALERIRRISDELNLIQKSSVTPQRENILKTLDDIIKEKRAEFLKHHTQISFANHLENENVKALYVREDFKRLFSNILNNAKESYKGVSGSVNVQVLMDNGCLKILVQDFGCGISKKDRTDIFKTGVSIGKPNGTGLGLAHAKECLLAWGGDILFKSSSEGTSVELILKT